MNSSLGVKIIKLLSLSLCAFLVTSQAQAANTNYGIFTAYTYINDLGLSLQDSQLNQAVSRSGMKMGADINWANVDYSGGPGVSLFANKDNDLSDNRNISDMGLMVNYLQPISSRWLLRSSLMLQQYRNEVVLATGFNGLGVNITAGYMGDRQQGVDITVKYNDESHQQDIADLYTTTRTELAASYYFARQQNQPFWVLQIRQQNNQADNIYRDYTSRLISVAYKGWGRDKLWGNLRLQQRQDDYQPVNSQARQDNLLFAGLDVFMMLSKQWQFRASLSSGIYESNLLTSRQNYVQISSGVQYRF